MSGKKIITGLNEAIAMTQPDKDSVDRFLHAPAGFMVAAKPDATDHELCPLYVRASDYDAAIKERDALKDRVQALGTEGHAHRAGWVKGHEAALAASGAAAAEEFDDWNTIGSGSVTHLREMYRPAYDALGSSGRTSLRNWVNSRVDRALTDAQAALDRALDGVREECAKLAEKETGWKGRPHMSAMGYGPGIGSRIAATIRALKRQPGKGE